MMDIIDRAVEQGLHVSGINRLNGQSWEEFEAAVKGKKLFLFGTGACAGIYFERCKGNRVTLEGILDNDSAKWGMRMDDIVQESFRSGVGDMRISDISVLGQYAPEDVAVLIASTKFYEDMVRQMEELGVKCCYILLIMEAGRRKERGMERQPSQDFLARRKAYVEECCKEELKENKVVFYSFGTYSDHGKYIARQLLKAREDLDIVWLLNDTDIELPEGMRAVPALNWVKYIYEMETAKVWVFNVEVPEYIEKRHGQIFVEAKHWASITLKKCYLDAVTLCRSPLYDNWKRNGRMMDYMLTGSQFDTEFCKRAFGFEKETVQVGSPRSDAVFHGKENREKICRYCNVDTEKHILMNALTFRFREGGLCEQKAPKIELDFEMLYGALQERWGGEWCILLRLHPGVARESGNITVPEYVVDVSKYSDSQELVAASDVVISDYSSIMFEPSFVKKPVFLFATDKKEYIDKEYNLLMDYDSLPFAIAESNRELAQCIRSFDKEEYERKLDQFLEKYGVHEDGHASERAAGFIAQLIPAGSEPKPEAFEECREGDGGLCCRKK